MRILFIGDTHGKTHLFKIDEKAVQRLGLSKEDVIIHVGDIGTPWMSDHDEVLDYWRSLPCDVMVNLGNHENYNWILRQPLVTKYGALCYQLGDNLFAPLIGEIATIFDKTFWFFPGGYSIDFRMRTLNKTLFVEELPLKTDADRAKEQLKKHGPVDVIVSHDGPRSFVSNHFEYPIGDVPSIYYEKTSQEVGLRVHPGFALDELVSTDLYSYWVFGHHHQDYQYKKFRALMHEMVLWDLENNTRTIIYPTLD